MKKFLNEFNEKKKTLGDLIKRPNMKLFDELVTQDRRIQMKQQANTIVPNSYLGVFPQNMSSNIRSQSFESNQKQ